MIVLLICSNASNFSNGLTRGQQMCVKQLKKVQPLQHKLVLFAMQVIQKTMEKSELDNTKITSFINYRGGDISDATRLYRKEQILKRKLKSIVEVNTNLEREIKAHQHEIRDERASIQFQLNDLNKEMSIKFACFTSQKLQRNSFLTNQCAHESMQNMMRKYEQIEKECCMLQKIHQSLLKINENYATHGKEMEELVLNSQKVSQDYESSMESTLNTLNEQIKEQMSHNQQAESRTQTLAKEIDGFVTGTNEMREEQQRVLGKIQRLKKMVHCQQEKVHEIQEWQDIVIDKSNRKALYRTLKEKQDYLQRLHSKNNQLQIYLTEVDHQLQLQQEQREQKENKAICKSVKTTQRTAANKPKTKN